MYQYHYLAGFQYTHGLGSFALIDLIYHLDFQEMVAGAQCAELGQSAFFGFLAYFVRVGPFEAA